jgi:hypothetical protein
MSEQLCIMPSGREQGRRELHDAGSRVRCCSPAGGRREERGRPADLTRDTVDRVSEERAMSRDGLRRPSIVGTEWCRECTRMCMLYVSCRRPQGGTMGGTGEYYRTGRGPGVRYRCRCRCRCRLPATGPVPVRSGSGRWCRWRYGRCRLGTGISVDSDILHLQGRCSCIVYGIVPPRSPGGGVGAHGAWPWVGSDVGSAWEAGHEAGTGRREYLLR